MKGPSKDALKALADKAKDAALNAHAPSSGFRVGAALLAKGGRVYTGCNVENPSLTMVVCAERVAILKAISEGERDFVAIAVAAMDKEHVTPCGSCRQLIYEFAPEALVVSVGKDGNKVKKIGELLPDAFRI